MGKVWWIKLEELLTRYEEIFVKPIKDLVSLNEGFRISLKLLEIDTITYVLKGTSHD